MFRCEEILIVVKWENELIKHVTDWVILLIRGEWTWPSSHSSLIFFGDDESVRSSMKLSTNWTTFIDETNEKENMSVPLRQTNPTAALFHMNRMIQSMSLEKKANNPLKSVITWSSSQDDQDSAMKTVSLPKFFETLDRRNTLIVSSLLAQTQPKELLIGLQTGRIGRYFIAFVLGINWTNLLFHLMRRFSTRHTSGSQQ